MCSKLLVNLFGPSFPLLKFWEMKRMALRRAAWGSLCRHIVTSVPFQTRGDEEVKKSACESISASLLVSGSQSLLKFRLPSSCPSFFL